jgi:glutathione S-transferase
MDDALRRTPFLVGDAYSLADAAITPYVLRAQLLGMAALWVDSRPNLTQWFERIRARPSFEEAVAGVMTDTDRERLTVPAHQTWPHIREILARKSE